MPSSTQPSRLHGPAAGFWLGHSSNRGALAQLCCVCNGVGGCQIAQASLCMQGVHVHGSQQVMLASLRRRRACGLGCAERQRTATLQECVVTLA